MINRRKKFFSQLPPNSQYGKVIKILLGIIFAVVIIVVIALSLTNGIADTAKEQLTAINHGNLVKAYSLTSNAFQQETSFDNFKLFIEKYPIMKNNNHVSFNEKKVDGNFGYLSGTIEDKDGSKFKIEFQLVKEQGDWKIQAFRLSNDTDLE